MRKRDNLDFIYRCGGADTFSENKTWKTGYSLFMHAKEQQEKMPILFSAADESSGLIYYAFLESIAINEDISSCIRQLAVKIKPELSS